MSIDLSPEIHLRVDEVERALSALFGHKPRPGVRPGVPHARKVMHAVKFVGWGGLVQAGSVAEDVEKKSYDRAGSHPPPLFCFCTPASDNNVAVV